ncbi:inward rectifier potassium channel [Mucilaginibacter gracilis]|uniref:Inward rectifier potassium channel n=1 Tax=Mucilaginibacter gracilis TaxID=423350 RepID=A0A495J5J3_9SPHI|nr:ion channel [Mucilaginibacter gracilis]RKR84245.1 inward rectifier potassium channel [Mucilaginibacter gracilis]
MGIRKVKANPESDMGLGTQAIAKNQRIFNQDGSINVKRKGLSYFNTANNYHRLITMKWHHFWLLILSGYLIVNLIFSFLYLALGIDNLVGAQGSTPYEHFFDAFFFSAQTITTVGYGHIYPHGIPTSSVSAIESMIGLLAFALATGLLYGRFSRPSAKITYSRHVLVAPYLEKGKALMFRLANQRRSTLIDLEIEVIFSYNEEVNGKTVRKFIPLELERKHVSILTLNWTVVHELNDDSPLRDITNEDLEKTEANIAVLLKAFDDTFSQTVHSRTSYQYDEVIWNAKFKPAFDRDYDGRMVLDLAKISDHERLENSPVTQTIDKQPAQKVV